MKRLETRRPINVFLSSICGIDKFDKLREEIITALEKTGLFKVYTFENEPGSTLNAGDHYLFGLNDSDVCVFLINNADGVTEGVKKEIRLANKLKKKSIYYFCDEGHSEKTELEISMLHAENAKSQVVHSFSDLAKDSCQALVDDITNIYRNYCNGNLIVESLDIEDKVDEKESTDYLITKKDSIGIIENQILQGDSCTAYLAEKIMDRKFKKDKKSSVLDNWGERFLKVIFGDCKIENFNTSLFLDDLAKVQDEQFHQVVSLRWKAISAHYQGNIDNSIKYLEQAKQLAAEMGLPRWYQNNILVDLIDEKRVDLGARNGFLTQRDENYIELAEYSDQRYFPIMDKIQKQISDVYVSGLSKRKLRSLNTETYIRNYYYDISFLSKYLMVAMYFGSMSHLLTFIPQFRGFLDYLIDEGLENWSIQLGMLKTSLYSCDLKDVQNLIQNNHEFLGNINSVEAKEVMEFCSSHPIQYIRWQKQIVTFGILGYYLNQQDFLLYRKEVFRILSNWINDDSSNIMIGNVIFDSLSNCVARLDQEELGVFCCQVMEKNKRRYYRKLISFIGYNLNLNDLTDSTATRLISNISKILRSNEDNERISDLYFAFRNLRNQDRSKTNELNEIVLNTIPKYALDSYLLDTEEYPDLIEYINKKLIEVNEDIVLQGKDGHYFEKGERYLEVIHNILAFDKKTELDDELLERVIDAAYKTLLFSKEKFRLKMDAASLLSFLAVSNKYCYPKHLGKYNEILEKSGLIINEENVFLNSNAEVMLSG